MSRLKRLLHDAAPSTCNTQQTPVQPCKAVAQHMHITQQAQEELRDLVLEVMALVDEPQADWQSYVDAALADPDNALTCYTSLKQELGQQTHQEAPTRHP